MEIPDQLLCKFTGTVEEQDGSFIIEVPETELQLGGLEDGAAYQVAVLGTSQTSAGARSTRSGRSDDVEGPPLEVGETRQVDIEGIGDQGDGITRVERGFVVIVPDTEKGERVRIEVTSVRDSVAFAEVIERIDYYE